MKSLLVATLLTLSTTAAFAQLSPKATLFKEAAEKAVSAVYGKAGDEVSSDLQDMNHAAGANANKQKETWNVQLGNAKEGSAVYKVKVSQKEDGSKTKIEIEYLMGN